jgi:hypothetical protein
MLVSGQLHDIVAVLSGKAADTNWKGGWWGTKACLGAISLEQLN